MTKKKFKEPDSLFMAHWRPLLNLVSLVEPPHLRKAILRWINQNQNCAYTMKTGACSMDCANCPNDLTIEHIIILKEKVTKTDQKKGESK